MNRLIKILCSILVLCMMLSVMTSCTKFYKKYDNSLVLDFNDVIKSYNQDVYDPFNGVNSVSWAQLANGIQRVRAEGYNCELYGYRYVSFECTRKYVETLKRDGFELSEAVNGSCPNIKKAHGYKLSQLLSTVGIKANNAANAQLFHNEDSLWLAKDKGISTSYVIIFSGQLEGETDALFILVISR